MPKLPPNPPRGGPASYDPRTGGGPVNRGSASRSWRCVHVSVQCRRGRCNPLLGKTPYFADIDKSAHEILVAERVDRLLGLIPCCVFHNPVEC